jgi:hypothetical protein
MHDDWRDHNHRFLLLLTFYLYYFGIQAPLHLFISWLPLLSPFLSSISPHTPHLTTFALMTVALATLAPAIPLPPLSRVVVVGAGGPSGLVAVRQLLEAGVRPSQIAAYELRATAGGVWNYDAAPGTMDVEWRTDGPPVVRSQREVDAPGTNGPSGELELG